MTTRALLTLAMVTVALTIASPHVAHAFSWPPIPSSFLTAVPTPPQAAAPQDRHPLGTGRSSHISHLSTRADSEAQARSRALWSELEAKGALSPCWKHALAALHSECTTIRASDALRSQLALAMAACDGEGDGREEAPAYRCEARYDEVGEPMTAAEVRRCVRVLPAHAYAIFVQYRLHADVLCAYLQEELYQQRTEAAVVQLQSAAALSARTMTSLRDASDSLLAAVRDGQAAQHRTRELTESLQSSLKAMKDGQTAALSQLYGSTATLHSEVTRTWQALGGLQAAITAAGEEAAARLAVLSDAAAHHHAAMEERTSGVLRVLGRVERVQRHLAERAVTAQHVLQLAAAAAVVVLATASPRTHAGRLPALACLAGGFLAPQLLPAWAAAGRALPWFIVSCVAATGAVTMAARTYCPPIALHRAALREEVLMALATHASPSQMHAPTPLCIQTPLRDGSTPYCKCLVGVDTTTTEAAAVTRGYRSSPPLLQLGVRKSSLTALPIHHEGDTSSGQDEGVSTPANSVAVAVTAQRRGSRSPASVAQPAKRVRSRSAARSGSLRSRKQ